MSNIFSQNIDKFFKNAIPLADGQTGRRYTILQCNLPQYLQTRFAELGFVRGANVTIVKKAPLGDPVEINVMGYAVCVRSNELKHITVVEADDE